MALSLAQFPTVPFNTAAGQPVATPIVLCTPATDKPTQTPIAINWADYLSQLVTNPDLGVVVNLFAGVQGAAKQIRGVYIDNSLSTAAIYVYFPGTNFTVFAPPGYLVMMPVITNLPNAIVYIVNADTNNLPLTNIIFSNVEFRPVYIPSPSASTSDVLPSVAYEGSVATSAAASTTRTFTNVPVGPVASDRLSVFIITWSTNISVNATLLSITVGGVAVTPFINISARGSGTAGGGGMAMCYVRVPAPFTTATVVATFSGNAGNSVCGCYMINGQNSDIPIDYSFGIQPAAGTNAAQTVAVGMRQYAVACYGAATAAGGAVVTLTNSFIDDNGQFAGGGSGFWGFSHYVTPLDQIRTVGNTGSALLGAAWF